MSKLHLPTDLSFVFNRPVYTPDDEDDEDFVLASWFLKAIATVAKSMTPTPNPAPFILFPQKSKCEIQHTTPEGFRILLC